MCWKQNVSTLEHLCYTFVREGLRITPEKVVRVRYMQETIVCPVCRQEDETTIKVAKNANTASCTQPRFIRNCWPAKSSMQMRTHARFSMNRANRLTQEPICGSISAEQMESLLSSCMITARDAAVIIPSSFCLVLPGCSTAMVIPHMEGSKALFWYAVWLIAGKFL